MKAEDKRVVLLNFAHRERVPCRKEGAAIRILGIFPDINKLSAHARKYYASGLDILAVPVSKWAAVLRRTQGGDELAHLQRLGRNYKERERRHEEEFRSNVSAQRTGEVTALRSKECASGEEVYEDDREEPDIVPRDAEIRLQRFAVISLLPDVEEPDTSLQEPAVLIWGAFDTEEDAKERIKTEFAVTARDVHLDTVSMYEWIPLTNLDLSQIREEFRDESLTDIMQARKDETKNVEQYRSLCEQRGQNPNVLDLDATASEATPNVPVPLECQPVLPNLMGEAEES